MWSNACQAWGGVHRRIESRKTHRDLLPPWRAAGGGGRGGGASALDACPWRPGPAPRFAASTSWAGSSCSSAAAGLPGGGRHGPAPMSAVLLVQTGDDAVGLEPVGRPPDGSPSPPCRGPPPDLGTQGALTGHHRTQLAHLRCRGNGREAFKASPARATWCWWSAPRGHLELPAAGGGGAEGRAPGTRGRWTKRRGEGCSWIDRVHTHAGASASASAQWGQGPRLARDGVASPQEGGMSAAVTFKLPRRRWLRPRWRVGEPA